MCWRVLQEGTNEAKGFSRHHVASEVLEVLPGLPIYIGQSLEEAATVIAQGDAGSITVLAALASPGSSLKRHLETVVRPWLYQHARRALGNQRLLLGVHDGDLQSQLALVDIVEQALPAFWEPATSTWEARREAMLDLLGKAQPFAFKPALQISPEAKLLIEALSGRWDYQQDRREKKNIFYYVANAFSLLVSSLQWNGGKDEEIKSINNWDYERNMPSR